MPLVLTLLYDYDASRRWRIGGVFVDTGFGSSFASFGRSLEPAYRQGHSRIYFDTSPPEFALSRMV